MQSSASPFALTLMLAASSMTAAPALFFGPEDLPSLRERVKETALAPVWQGILERAEKACDPQSGEYADPANPFTGRAKSAHMDAGRHAALVVHSIGRRLNDVMESVGFAYQITGREDLGRHGAAFLHAIATQYPSTREEIAKGFAGGRGDVMRGLALGCDWLWDAMSESQRQEVAEVAKGYLTLFCEEFENPRSWWYKIHNYNGVNGGAAGCLALALRTAHPEEAPSWIDRAVAIVERWMTSGFDEEGAYFEGISYSAYGLSSTLLFADALRRAGSRHDLYRHPLFQQLGTYYALSLLPGESVYDARNNANYAGLGGMLLGLAKALDSGLYRWLWDVSGSDRSFQRIIWDNAVKPEPPAAAGIPTAAHFRGRGLCIWRTGWTRDDVMFSIEAGRYHPTTHNQADKGHFTLYGLGHRWAVDTGYANERSPRGRGQAHAHSCVLINGAGQALSGAGLGTHGTIAVYDSNERRGYALADCTEAYQRNHQGMPGVGVAHARRHAFFVYPRGDAPAYAVVLDDIRKDDDAHDFTWQMMIAPNLEAAVAANGAVLTPDSASGQAYVDTPWTDSDDAVASVAEGTQPPGEVAFDLDVREAGSYTLWARVRTQAPEPAKADSFFVQMDDGRQVDWHTPGRSSWTWGRVAEGVARKPVVYDLEPGVHRLVFRRREPAAELDCLTLTADAANPPVLEEARRNPLFREAESGQVTAPMRIVGTPGRPTRLLLRLDAVAPMAVRTDVAHTEDYHGPGAFPLLRADTRAINPRFAAVLLPLPGQTPDPTVTFAQAPAGREIRVAWPSHEDVLFWPDDASERPRLD